MSPHIGNFPREYPKPLSIGPPNFVPEMSTADWLIRGDYLASYMVLTKQDWVAPVILPHMARINKITLYGYREDELSEMLLVLRRYDHVGGFVEMATVTADWTAGEGSGYDDSISYPAINNQTYTYVLRVSLTMNDSVGDAYFRCAVIDWN